MRVVAELDRLEKLLGKLQLKSMTLDNSAIDATALADANYREDAIIGIEQQRKELKEVLLRTRVLPTRVPLFILAAGASGLPLAWLASSAGRRRRARAASGRCIACGYDLRATPQGGRCPECGAVPETA